MIPNLSVVLNKYCAIEYIYIYIYIYTYNTLFNIKSMNI